MCPTPTESDHTQNIGATVALDGSKDIVPSWIPDHDAARSAFVYAREHLHSLIFAHSVRVYLLAYSLGTRENSTWVSPDEVHLLFAACMLHDAGTSDAHNGSQRFEVEGGDAATALLRQHSVSDSAIHEVWVAIALHTSPGIAERISELARLVRLAVAMDFKRPAALALTTQEEIDDVEADWPRGEIEKVLGDAVVGQVLHASEEDGGVKAPAASWPGVLVRSAKENADWQGVNRAF